MSEFRLYKINTEICVEMVVLASSIEEAKLVAIDNVSDEIQDTHISKEDFETCEINKEKDIPNDWLGSLPYVCLGVIDENEFTVRELLERQIQADKRAKEEAEDIDDFTEDMFGDLD